MTLNHLTITGNAEAIYQIGVIIAQAEIHERHVLNLKGQDFPNSTLPSLNIKTSSMLAPREIEANKGTCFEQCTTHDEVVARHFDAMS